MEWSYLAPGVHIKGVIRCDGPLRIDGHIEGELQTQDELLVGHSGNVQGTIEAACLMVDGHIEGETITSQKIELLSRGKIVGELYFPKGGITVDRGGILEGGFHVEAAEAKPDSP